MHIRKSFLALPVLASVGGVAFAQQQPDTSPDPGNCVMIATGKNSVNIVKKNGHEIINRGGTVKLPPELCPPGSDIYMSTNGDNMANVVDIENGDISMSTGPREPGMMRRKPRGLSR